MPWACRTIRNLPAAARATTLAGMRIIDPQSGRAYLEKRRWRYNVPGEPRELTFSCYRRFPFVRAAQTREWFRDSLEAAGWEFGFQLWRR